MKPLSHKLTCELLLGVMTLISGVGVGLHWVFGCCHPRLLGQIHFAVQETSGTFAASARSRPTPAREGPAVADSWESDDCPLCQLLAQFHAPKIQRSELVLPLTAVSAPVSRSLLLTPRALLGVPPARGPPTA
jgi:hypothetical protein